MDTNLLFYSLVSYLIGSIPFAYILTKKFGFGDIRNIGSGNVGATNVLRTGKKNLAFAVLILDVIKGSLIIIFFNFFYTNLFETNEIIFLGSFSIIGHIFPIWLKFKGGKGVATYIGFVLSIDYKLGIFFILTWIIIAVFKRYSSLASILSLIILPFVSLIFVKNFTLFIILIFLSILVIIKHYSNIKRLFNNSESKIKL